MSPCLFFTVGVLWCPPTFWCSSATPLAQQVRAGLSPTISLSRIKYTTPKMPYPYTHLLCLWWEIPCSSWARQKCPWLLIRPKDLCSVLQGGGVPSEHTLFLRPLDHKNCCWGQRISQGWKGKQVYKERFLWISAEKQILQCSWSFVETKWCLWCFCKGKKYNLLIWPMRYNRKASLKASLIAITLNCLDIVLVL